MERFNTNSMLATTMAASHLMTEKSETEPRRASSQNKSEFRSDGDYIDFDGELHLSKKRLDDVRHLLRRYKTKETTERENIIIAHAMECRKTSIVDEADERAFTVLLLSYFHNPTLSAFDISKALNIHDRTVFKDIAKGVSQLAVFVFGIGAFTVTERD